MRYFIVICPRLSCVAAVYIGVELQRCLWYASIMRTAKEIDGRMCPKCGQSAKQVNSGTNRSGTQRCKCKECNITYTLNPKSHAYSEEVRTSAIKVYYSGVSGRGVGRLLGMSKNNVYKWLKKTESGVDKSNNCP